MNDSENSASKSHETTGAEHSAPVHVSVVLDRSGSMASIASDMVGGFNTFLEEQRAHPGGGRITLAQFDSQDPFEILIEGEDLATVQPLDQRQYLPRGSTPLNDAVGRMITRIDQSILTRADVGQPIEDQVVLIVTDGYENASHEFSGRMIADLIEARRQRAWAFVFLGSDESTFSESARMGFALASTARYEKSGKGTRDMFARTSKELAEYRTMDDERRRAKSEKFMEEE